MSKNYKDCNTVFYKRAYDLIKTLGDVTQKTIAEYVGVGQSKINDILQFECNPQGYANKEPKAETVVKIAKAFNVSTDYLLGLTDCRNPNNPKLVARCGELEERLLLLEAKSRTFDKLLSSIRDISLEYVKELGLECLLQREVENGGTQDVCKNNN